MLPAQTEFTILAEGDRSKAEVPGSLGVVLDKLLSGLDVDWKWDERVMQGILRAKRNVWSRAARRQALRASGPSRGVTQGGNVIGTNSSKTFWANGDGHVGENVPDGAIPLAVKIIIQRNGDIHLRWLQGQDYIMFESFHGWLKRQPPLRMYLQSSHPI
jgi:23S rRNA (adenine1618-N6)-methyltransferase